MKCGATGDLHVIPLAVLPPQSKGGCRLCGMSIGWDGWGEMGRDGMAIQDVGTVPSKHQQPAIVMCQPARKTECVIISVFGC
jgi:hypothetical protein